MAEKRTVNAQRLVKPKMGKMWVVRGKKGGADDIREDFLANLRFNIAKDRYTLTMHDTFLSLSFAVRERLIESWIVTQQEYHRRNAKRVYYLSLEFLLGRLLENNIINLDLSDSCRKAMGDLELDYETILDQEADAGLGNGGLGRLAACFLDSMATLKLPAIGYGIRYEFGIFRQKIVNGFQREVPEEWLQYGNPWEIERPEYKRMVKLYGKTVDTNNGRGDRKKRWVDTLDVVAIPYDVPIPGYGCDNVNTLRLWSAQAAHEFDLQDFNTGDYIGACQEKLDSENISKVLYPNDSNHSGRELRLKQQYFFSSASLQDIIRRYLCHNEGFDAFPDKVAIQINDTHPAIAIVELMRLLVDDHDVMWDKAWDIVVRTFAYTNHTLMPEALERWSVSNLQNLLPRHMEIIYEINARFLRQISYRYHGDNDRLRRMSLIEEGEDRKVRMAFLAIVGSHSVNGVAALHTELLKNGLVRDFYELWPEKFNNKTNGITQRRWLYKANPGLSRLISGTIGDGWIKDLSQLKGIAQFADDEQFQKRWNTIKRANKEMLAEKLLKQEGIAINPDMMFDIQVKRFHEYKRQLLAALHCVALYNRLKKEGTEGFVPRTVIFAGKAAPGYHMAKLIIKFINDVSAVINNDPDVREWLQVHFIPNYSVSLAEMLIPAADVSEQISTAGTEASGTGNMKFALNGALTVGTMDGANIEIYEEVGPENIFIFGLRSDEVASLRSEGYNPRTFYDKSQVLRDVMGLVASGFFCPLDLQLHKPIVDSLLDGGDPYMVLADFESYRACQEEVAAAYRDTARWTRMAIMNVANMGRFSSDRTIKQYADEIWKIDPLEVNLPS